MRNPCYALGYTSTRCYQCDLWTYTVCKVFTKSLVEVLIYVCYKFSYKMSECYDLYYSQSWLLQAVYWYFILLLATNINISYLCLNFLSNSATLSWHPQLLFIDLYLGLEYIILTPWYFCLFLIEGFVWRNQISGVEKLAGGDSNYQNYMLLLWSL